ncbi:hypothetical protein L9F63_011447 [Diploptera punctata]|uniref:Protein cueball n=1 Tax=Diploptera punctata TaxID=6984 RepID=A0AAD8AEL3_DIPPU|nr:hypothetical protein L9F63_011447 [Diploptera punctata]
MLYVADIAVVTTEQVDANVITGQVDFFNRNGSLQKGTVKSLTDVQALAYNPVKDSLFVSDDTNKNYSIFTLNLRGSNKDLFHLLKVRNGNSTVRDIAYDVESDTLYWTSENAIYWYNKTMKNKMGEILIQLDEKDIPHGITLDRCRGYIYWTNRYHINPSIERASLDGSNREVVVNKELFRPLGIAVDEPAGKLYWSNDKEGIYYDIRRADLNGKNIEVLLESKHHDPVDLAIGPHEIYWTDNVHSAVWKIPKYHQKNDEPIKIHQFIRRTPQGIVTWTDGKVVCHQETTSTTTKATSDYLSDEPVVVSQSSIKEMSDYCLNSGELVPGKISKYVCQCQIGYSGKRCEVDVCHNYCLNNGQCEVDRNYRPTCVCPLGAEGSRCELHVCSDYCLNDGVCDIDINGKPVCACKGNLVVLGVGKCQTQSDCAECIVSICTCFGERGQYDIMPTENNTVTNAELKQSCELGKTISDWVSIVLGAMCVLLTIVSIVLFRKVIILKRRPRIKKRIIVNKNVTPLTSRPPQSPEQCEITIENCCNMNICETPCFEPQTRTPKPRSSQREEKKTLLGSMEDASTSSPCRQDDLY